jgi:uncharacterized protein (TIGR03546 family)
MLHKKISKFILGSASTSQIILACILAGMLGFMPGLSQAAGSIAVLSILLLVFNCNLGLAALVSLASKFLSLLLMPATFALGQFLLDGPAQGFFVGLINAPVSALFGLEYYLTTGGLLLGAVFGSISGIALSRAVRGIRIRLATAEADSESFNRIMAHGATRILIKLSLGGVPTSGYAELLKQKSAPIRISGVAMTLGLVATIYAGLLWLDGPLVGRWVQSALERANGATVDLASADLDLEVGVFTLTGLAIADPNALETDLFRAGKISLNISTADLLRKRLRIEKIEVEGGTNGPKREKPGQLVQKLPEVKADKDDSSGKSLDAYIAQSGDWKKRFSQVKTWLDTMSSSGSHDGFARMREQVAGDPSLLDTDTMTLEEWLDREIQAQGYAHVRADHLIQGSPTLQIDWVHAPDTTTSLLVGETLDVQLRNLSTQPHLVDKGPSLNIESQDRTIDLALSLDAVSYQGGANRMKIVLLNLPADDLVGQLASGEGAATGGTVDIRVKGRIENRGGAWVDLPVAVTLRNSMINFSGQKIPVKNLQIPVRVTGPLDNLGIQVNEEKLFASLSKAAGGALANKAKGIVGQELDKATGGLMSQIGDKVGGEKTDGDSEGLLESIGGAKGLGGFLGK